MKARVTRVLLLLLISWAASGQYTALSDTPKRLVRINICVRDKNGPVEGLTKGDFVLYDENKKREIAFFEAHSRRRSKTPEPGPPLGPNEFTNVRQGSAFEDRNAVVIVWDLINTRFPDESAAKRAVLKSLSAIRPGDRVGVYILGGHFAAIQEFTSDSSQLASTLQTYAQDPNLWRVPDEYLLPEGRQTGENSSRRLTTKASVREILIRMAGVRGRRSVIWISAQPPADTRLWESAVSLYMVDARGLRDVMETMPDQYAFEALNGWNPQAPNGRIDAPPLMASGAHIPRPTPAPALPFDPSTASMQMSSDGSGGKAFLKSDDIRGAIEQAFEDGDVTYTLGFYARPSRGEKDEYRSVKVKIKRRGATARYPLTYPVASLASTPDELMPVALMSDLELAELGLRARLERDGGALRLSISVRTEDGGQTLDGGPFATRLDYMIAQRAGNSDLLGSVSKSVMLSRDPSQRKIYLNDGLNLIEDLTPKTGLASIRIVAIDRSSGAIGTLTVPVSAELEGAAAVSLSEKRNSGPVGPPVAAEKSPKSEEPGESPAVAVRAQAVQPASGGSAADPLIRRAADATLEFSETLPNFICRETISRFHNRTGAWRNLDTVETDLVYSNGLEDYLNITIDGKRVTGKVQEMGAWSTGEFGTVLRNLFAPDTMAEFQFLKTSRISGADAHEYSFSVKEERSMWRVHLGEQSYKPAYRGKIWIAPSNGRALRIEMQATEFPADFPVERAETALEYGYVRLGGTAQFLLPVRATTVECQRGFSPALCFRNFIDFSKYRKFEAESNIQYFATESSIRYEPAAARAPEKSKSTSTGGGLSADPVIRRAAEAAGEFTKALPNYICREAVARSESVDGGGRWRPLDNVEADLILEDGKEAYRNITVNGLATGKMMEDLSGTRSTGEFATLMRMLFSPSTNAEFRFTGTAPLAGIEAREYTFSVPRERSSWIVHVNPEWDRIGYKGKVSIDPSNARVLRIEMTATELPPNLGVVKLETATEYDYLLLSGIGPYLLPVRATLLTCRKGGLVCHRNAMEFRNYRKFEAESGIQYGEPK